MDLELFLSRFHPLIVHLPIGFLLLAAIMEGMSLIIKKKYKGMDLAISVSLFSGGLAAVASAITGYLLSQDGGYDDQTLFWHKWLGISLIVIAFLGWAIKSKRIKLGRKSFPIIAVVLVVLMSITGHLGGNLTHGSDYLLVHAPEFLQKIGGMDIETANNNLETPKQLDSIIVFEHLIQPFLTTKCSSCHSETKANGGLILTTTEGIDAGGDGGFVVLPGKLYDSELFLRATLPQNSKKFMPPKGEPLNFSEIKLLEWWISTGASYDANLSTYEVPQEIKMLLDRDFGIDTKAKLYYDQVQVPLLSNTDIIDLQEFGIKAIPLSDGHHLLDVSLTTSEITDTQTKALLNAKEQITWLDLGNSSLKDDMLVVLGQLANLTHLNLNSNPITDLGIQHLKNLGHLEVLNLYATNITNESLKTISKLTSLKRVYLWQTQVSAEAITLLKKQLPEITVIGIPEQ